MERSNIQLIPPGTPWLRDPALRRVCDAIMAEGAEVYLVGGCVRDAILGVGGSDIDMATPLRPAEVTRLAKAAGLKVVPTGIDHGTVTVVADGTGFEITSFRRDVATDGRRATVAFSDDIAEDARRRDFTLNALYATPGGQIIDPLGGLGDCLARRIRFIENASDRIQEDYLRTLRFFRFHAWYAAPDEGFDPDALDAIASNTAGLETLSAERVGQEMRKLLGAPDPVRAVAGMQHTGALTQVLPGSDITQLGPVVHIEASLHLEPDWRLRLAALGGQNVPARLRLSTRETKHLEAIGAALSDMTPESELAYRKGFDLAVHVMVLRAALAQHVPERERVDRLKTAAAEKLPVSARDFMPDLSGPALGAHLSKLEALWIASDFSLSRIELLSLD